MRHELVIYGRLASCTCNVVGLPDDPTAAYRTSLMVVGEGQAGGLFGAATNTTAKTYTNFVCNMRSVNLMVLICLS
jgi:hypothetical protein